MYCCLMVTSAQEWSSTQINEANTAKNTNYLSEKERNIILYLNLVRLYPQDFLSIEIENYEIDPIYTTRKDRKRYIKSLKSELEALKPTQKLHPDKYLFDMAKCFAKESGRSGYTGHKRKRCKYPEIGQGTGECCSYGFSTGREVVIELLIDSGVRDLGHRKLILLGNFNKVGVSIQKHKKYREGAVIDFANYK